MQSESFLSSQSRKDCEIMKAVIYARQSSGEEELSASIEQQIENCKQLAKDNDIIIAGIYQDLNISGKTYPDTAGAAALAAVDSAYKSWVNSTYLKTTRFRKGLGEVFAALKNVDYILLDDFTRLMRPLPASYLESHVIQCLRTAGVKIYCVKGGIIDTSSFADNLVTTLISQVNANQIEIQRQKSITALRNLRDTGYRTNGSDFYGYHYVKDQTFEIVPEEAEAVRRAYELGIRHIPFGRICRILGKVSGKGYFIRATLNKIFRRPEYAGYQFNSHQELIPSLCFQEIPLITLAQFNQMQERLKNKKIHNHDRKETYAFTGLCHCGYCGSRMQIKYSSHLDNARAKERPRFFECVRNHSSYNYRPECGISRIRYQYCGSPFHERLKRSPVTKADLKKTLIPAEFCNCGLFESLMPLIAVPLIKERRKHMISQNIQEKIQKLEMMKQKQLDYEKKLGAMLLDEKIDDAQFTLMAAGSREKKETISKQILELMEQSISNRTEQDEELSKLLYILQLKHIDKHLYKKYAQMTIARIALFACHIEIEFANRKCFTLERIPNRSARGLPDWSLEVKNDKAYIKYYYKNFYKGDTEEQIVLEDEMMKIVTVGKNPVYQKSLPKPLAHRAEAVI